MKTFSSPRSVLRCRALPRPLRWITWLVVGSQFLPPYANSLLAAAAEAISAQHQAVRVEEPSVRLTPVTTPEVVAVNRTVPNVQPPPANASFSADPSEEEIFRARVFTEPLVPMGNTTARENKAIAAALLSFLRRASNDDVAPLTQFLADFPQSAWRVSLLTDLGIVYRRTGHFCKALAVWEEAWELGKNQTEPNTRAIVDRAVAELAELNARVGRYERLEPLFAEIEGREFHGPATQKVEGARRGLWLMRHQPEKSFRCGPLALDRIRAFHNPADAFDRKIQESRSTTSGMSLSQVAALAKDLNMDYQIANRAPGAKIVLPAVVHWKVGHYAALVKEENSRFLVKDPTFTDDIWISQAALDEETTGYFLIPSGSLPTGWRPVDEAEAEKVWGKGVTYDSDPDDTRCTDATVPECPREDCEGMARYSFHTMLVSLHIIDTPVGYTPPRGQAVKFKVTYNQREANTYRPSVFNYSNLGNQWTFGWFAYLTDDPNNGTNDVYYFMQGGGTEVYSGFNSGTSAVQKDSHALLVRTSSTSYERRLPDGSKQIFNLPNGANAFPRNIFLTQQVDPAGNTLTFTFDSNFRLVAATDALGQVTTLSYTLAADSLKITKVTDPFGRYATFDYAQSGGIWQLVKITDVVGITSQFSYSGDFITSLTTPYGPTIFTQGQSGTTRWLEATDPIGQTEHLEYHDAAPGVAASEALVPTGLNTFNQYLNYRSSYYWDKEAWHDYPGDFTKAHHYHFTHTTDMQKTSGTLESDKQPLESRIWRNYDGQPDGQIFTSAVDGTNGSPSKIARVLDDGSTQLYQFQYNAYGKVTKSTDPSGRATTNTYASNGLDLTEVRQVTGSTNQLLARFTYNSLHLPLTAVDAAGKTNFFGYNAKGQLVAATNALNQIILFNLSTNGYLTNFVRGWMAPPQHGNTLVWTPLLTNSFTYDGYGRIRTSTDSEGYTVTFDYDALNRPTKVTYPDNTYEQVVYRFLDPILRKDRRGHSTATTFDQLRRVTDVQDWLNRITHLEWCGCGGLASITDPAGNVTTWLRDLQGRVTAKIYPDTTQNNYAYETNTSRLRAVADAKNQTTIYDYMIDNNLKQVAYSNAVIATPSVAFTYDTNYNRLLTMTDGIGTTTYGYNTVAVPPALGAGRLASVDGPLLNDTVTYQYDELGRLTNRAINGVAQKLTFDSLRRITNVNNALGSFTNVYVGATARISTNFYPNGQRTVFSYYANTNDQRLQTIWNEKSNGTNISKFDYTYDADGQISTWTQQADANTPNVLVTEYDPVDQLLGVTVHSNSIAGAILKQFVYAYDKAGNRTGETIQNGGGSTPALSAATYNNLNQLTNTTGGGPMRFKGHLDELGTVTVAGTNAPVDSRTTNFVGFASVNAGTNVIPIVATDYSGNVRSNRYQVIVTNNGVAKTFKYDPKGNLTNVTTATYTNTYEWDAADRLTAINGLTNRSEFTYDGFGRRVKILEKQNGVPVTTNYYLWCGTELCEQRNSTGGAVTKRFFGQGEQISGTNYFFTRDHLGSVREMTDGTGTVRARYDYDPYGRRTKVSGNLDSDFGFTGYYCHTVSGVHLALYRAYDADAGRWISRDPIRESSGINLYLYARSDPIDRVDPSGLNAYVVNAGGLTGHTSFVVDDPSGGVIAYHFFAGHHSGDAPWYMQDAGLVYDSVHIWSQHAASLEAFLAGEGDVYGGAVNLFGAIGNPYASVGVWGMGLGTQADDVEAIQRMLDEIQNQEEYYSFIGGSECHSKSWEWFQDYTWGGTLVSTAQTTALMPLTINGQSVPPPDSLILTPRVSLPTLP